MKEKSRRNRHMRKKICTAALFLCALLLTGCGDDGESIYKMWIVDFLISNRDRHGQNWGFYYDTETMEILGCHPLFDHNNAFDIDFMRDMDAPYQFGEMTIRQAAKKAMEKVDFHFTAPITRADFITDRQYQSFCKRAKCLGLKME